MKRLIGVVAVAGLALVALVPLGAEAAPCMPSDVTFRGFDSDACFDGTTENTPEEPQGNVFDPAWGEFDFVVKAEFEGQATYDGIDWTLTADEDTAGEWLLVFESDPSVTKTYDMVAAFKGALTFAAYLFESEEFTTDGEGPGTFSITFLNPAGNIPDLSHLSVYLRPVENGGGPPQQVPAPATLLLLGIGLASAGLVGWRKIRG